MTTLRSVFLRLLPLLLFAANGCQQPTDHPQTQEESRKEFQFEAMGKTILQSLTEHSARKDGGWNHSQTGDIHAVVCRLLFDLGRQLGNDDLVDRARKTVEWCEQKSGKEGDGKLEGMTLLPAFIDAYVYTKEDRYRSRVEKTLTTVNELLLLSARQTLGPGGSLEKKIYDPLFLLGTLLTVDSEFAIAIQKVRGADDPVAQRMLAQTRRLIDLMDKMFGCRDEKSGRRYYRWSKDTQKLLLGENCMPVMGLASYYAATKDPTILEKVVELVSILKENLWNGQAYLIEPGGTYIGLAENNAVLYGQLLLLEASADRSKRFDEYIQQVESFYSYVESEGGLFKALPAGFKVILHDNEGVYGPWYWCSGCNVIALYNILMLNRLRRVDLPREFALARCTAPPVSPPVRIVITGGVHGNERSGAAALPALEKRGFITFGPCNPWGLEHNRRELADGRDLNRSFAYAKVEEARLVREFLRQHPYDIALDLHEDGSSDRPYLIQIGPDDDPAFRVVAALSKEYEFDPAPSWGPIQGKDGVIRPSKEALAIEDVSGIWSLSYYAWRTGHVTAITVECPTSWPMEKRIAFHVRVAETCRDLLRK